MDGIQYWKEVDEIIEGSEKIRVIKFEENVGKGWYGHRVYAACYKDEKLLCEDNCESLGKWPVFFDPNVHHIDTSSFAIRRDIAVRIGHAWYGQWGADRQFYQALSTHFPNYDCTNAHTLCYRLDGNPNSVKADFFESGNAINSTKYNGNFPWKKNKLLQIEPRSLPVGQVISVHT